MLSDPIKFFDGLIRGIVLTFYDLVLLSMASLAFPFVRKTKRFWPTALSINRRVSSLTLLLIWLFFFFALTANDLPDLVARAVSNREAGSKPIEIILAALIGTVTVDIALRTFCLLIKKPKRRSLYQELLRTSVAGVFFVACIVMLIGENSWLFGRLDNLIHMTFLGVPDAIWKLYVPGLSVCFLAAKGLNIQNTTGRSIAASVGAIIVPSFIVGTAAFVGLALQLKLRPFSELREPIHIVQSNTRCEFIKGAAGQQPSKIKVITYLKLAGDSDKSAVLPLTTLVASREKEDGVSVSVGNFQNAVSEVILSNASFNRFEFIVDFLLEGNEDIARKSEFGCGLSLLGRGLFGHNLGIDNMTVKDWR